MENIMKIIKSFEDYGLSLKGVRETIQNEAKEQKGGFLSMLLGTLGASLLGNMLPGKGINRAGCDNKGDGAIAMRQGRGIIRAGYGSEGSYIKKYKLIQPHPLTNFVIQKYYQNEPRFNIVYSRDNLPDKIKDGAYVINLEEYSNIGTHWVALYVLNNNVTFLTVLV